jgi:hypothetical protein
MLIDIAITATQRPELLQRTLASFYKNLFEPIAHHCRAVINIDPVGGSMTDTHAAINVVNHYFSNAIFSLPSEASFPKAFIAVWKLTNAPYVFHLEEDWELTEHIDIHKMMRLLSEEKQLAVLRLPFKDCGLKSSKNWNKFFPWNGKYFQCPEEEKKAVGFCGHPSLLQGSFVKKVLPFMNPERNPEKQFHDSQEIVNIVRRHEFGVFGTPNSPAVIRDIGREWMVAHGFVKKGNKAYFTEWTKL